MNEWEEEIELIDTLRNRCLMKIKQNREKPGWKKLTIKEAFDRLYQEIEELREAIDNDSAVYEVYNEAADVANFVAFIMDLYKEYALKRPLTAKEIELSKQIHLYDYNRR